MGVALYAPVTVLSKSFEILMNYLRLLNYSWVWWAMSPLILKQILHPLLTYKVLIVVVVVVNIY